MRREQIITFILTLLVALIMFNELQMKKEYEQEILDKKESIISEINNIKTVPPGKDFDFLINSIKNGQESDLTILTEPIEPTTPKNSPVNSFGTFRYYLMSDPTYRQTLIALPNMSDVKQNLTFNYKEKYQYEVFQGNKLIYIDNEELTMLNNPELETLLKGAAKVFTIRMKDIFAEGNETYTINFKSLSNETSSINPISFNIKGSYIGPNRALVLEKQETAKLINDIKLKIADIKEISHAEAVEELIINSNLEESFTKDLLSQVITTKELLELKELEEDEEYKELSIGNNILKYNISENILLIKEVDIEEEFYLYLASTDGKSEELLIDFEEGIFEFEINDSIKSISILIKNEENKNIEIFSRLPEEDNVEEQELIKPEEGSKLKDKDLEDQDEVEIETIDYDDEH